MQFKDLKDKQFFYMGHGLFMKRLDLNECCTKVLNIERNSVYMSGELLGYPCCIHGDTIIAPATANVIHTPQKTFKDIPINKPFLHGGQSWFKLNDKVAVPSKNIEGVLEFGEDVVVEC